MKFAVPRGRLMKDSITLLNKSGIKIDIKDDRKLFFYSSENEIIFPKPMDIPTYVEYNADIGICGSDVLIENKNYVFSPLELDFGKCRLSLISDKKYKIRDLYDLKIATRHPEITYNYFKNLGINVNIIKLNGSLEIAPLTGIADAIVDVVETGETLRKNNLVEIKKIMDISAVLIVNRVSMKTKYDEINNFIDSVKGVLYEL